MERGKYYKQQKTWISVFKDMIEEYQRAKLLKIDYGGND